jgi:hypothetical protein
MAGELAVKMSEISVASIGARQANGILALKLQLQQEAAVLSLVEKALESPQKTAGPAPASDKLVAIVV